MKNIKLIITDLDDTIWNWLTMWYNSFHPYFKNIQKVSNIDENILKQDFKALHQKYGTSEISYAYKELKSINRKTYKLIEKAENGDISIIHRYYRDKKENLDLYNDVRETLMIIKSYGIKLIGFTESNIFYTKYRIRTLYMDGIFDVIYTPDDHKLPKSVKRFYPKEYWDLQSTRIELLPKKFKKPNYEILLKILNDNNTDINDAIYIGDKLDRDIYMANQIKLTSVHAMYGHNIDNDAYNLLREVTHWTDDEVKREIEFKNATSQIKIQPDYVINNFKDILNLFNFEIKYTNEDKTNIINIWEKIVDVQQHFNDIEIRIRNFALTLFTFIFGAIGFCLKENITFYLLDISIPIASLIGFIGLIIVLAIYIMDRHWYHRLLHASVNQGLLLEKKFSKIYPHINLTTNIKKNSPISTLLKKFKIDIHSDGKLRLFYLLLSVPLIVSSISIFSLKNNNIINNEYNKLQSNSTRITLNSYKNNLPETSGLIISLNKDYSLYFVSESSNICKDFILFHNKFLSNNIDLINDKISYYIPVNFGRKELEEIVKKRGIKFIKN